MSTNLKSPTPAKPFKPSTGISKVRVVVRVRPFLIHEISSKNENPVPCVSILSVDSEIDSTNEVSVHLKDQETSRQEWYKLDGYFGEEDDGILRIFEKEVKPLIPGVFQGYNATVFAYGATGSGKTYTMQGTEEQPGLMPLALSTILSMCEATGSIAEVSYYEVYFDRCYDLLEPKAKEISVLDDKEGQIHLKGLSRVLVTSISEFDDVFARGIQRRKVAHTGLNDVSSRSHGVLVITVSKPSGKRLEASVTGKLNLVDLAGNEDNRRSGNKGNRLQESTKINQSLFTLSNVIYALNNNKPRVPYRETKLTRVLQDSLGGTSRALMIACLNPGAYQEAVHTVSLAARSRHVSNAVSLAQKQETPKAKIDMEAKLLSWLESKGKPKSTQRKIGFGSPFFPKSPGNMSSVNKQAVSRSFVKAKAANPGVTMKDRKLFVTDAESDSGKDDIGCVQELESLNDLNLSKTDEVLTTLEDRQSSSISALQELESSHFCFPEGKDLVAKDSINQTMTNGTSLEPITRLPDETLEDEEKASNRAESVIQSPPNRSKIIPCQSPLRKALSPVNPNIARMPIKEISSRDNVLSLLLESSAPKTPLVVTREKFQDFDTPLDKFNARSSNMKCYLVQEYIDFLNTATREELLELKGIGVKRAECIIELRKSSPLKSLSDLEKIGLSSKQVQHLFSKAAKDIFA